MSTLELAVDPDLPRIDVRGYHERSKHRFDAYAKGPETIDWDDQPDPFRRFSGTALVSLPLLRDPGIDAQLKKRWQSTSLDAVLASQPLLSVNANLQSIALWLEYSLALSAWKKYGSARWSLRCNPSSGNLHPTEAYVIARGVEDLADGVYHYRADCHALELRCELAAASRADCPGTVPQLYVGLSSVHWREAWKYGERAYRYCHLDIGHAVACLGYAAAINGWLLRFEPIADDDLARLLGTSRRGDFVAGEEESADCLLRIVLDRRACEPRAAQSLAELVAAAGNAAWRGKAEVLDRHHFYQWPVIDAITAQVRRSQKTAPIAIDSDTAPDPMPAAMPGECAEPLYRVIRQRRSAQAFDGYTSIGRDAFFVLLDHLLPRLDLPPWSALAGDPAIHCIFFVHRVECLAPGLYVLARSRRGEDAMRREMRTEFRWQSLADAPRHLRFYQLVEAKAQRTAAKLSCQQSIAGDSAFSLAMVAEFTSAVADSPWRYRELLWEAGALGQQLYLEAEAIGLRGTGIGCFFDDAVHQLLGIQGDALQSLYHFTVGGALPDSRIASFPPYSEKRRQA